MRQTFSEFHDPDDDVGLVGEDRTDEFSRPDRRLPTMLLTVLAMALFAGGLWFAYVEGTRHPAATAQGGGVPLLRADEQPTKVKPDQPGGMKIPDQNVSLYNEQPGGASVEKLLPAPEQPMPRTGPAAKDAAAPATPASSAALPPAAKTAAKAVPRSKEAALATAASTAAGRTSAVQVQLGSLRSAEAAREEWSRLKRENGDLLGKLTAVAVRTDLGDKGIYYRILAGSFGDAAAAEKLCSALKRRDFGCVLAR